jgi:hypothetical protein
LPISAGRHSIAVALQDVRRCTGVNDFFDDYRAGGGISGISINGPFDISGPGDTPSRRAIFSCYPEAESEARTCAGDNLARLATRGWRVPVTAASEEAAQLLAFYDRGNALGGFEIGMQYAIARLLMDPRFLYQVEDQPEGLAPGTAYPSGGTVHGRRVLLACASDPACVQASTRDRSPTALACAADALWHPRGAGVRC